MNKITIHCQINGKNKTLSAHPMARLLDVIREEAKLTGTKEGCGEGECGACSVLMDGEVVNSCLVPCIQAEGTQITTIEGLAKDNNLHPLQKAFIECGGAQCGICTPGMLIASESLLEQCRQKNKSPTEEEIRIALAGNLCRCTGYKKIFDSVKAAATEGKTEITR